LKLRTNWNKSEGTQFKKGPLSNPSKTDLFVGLSFDTISASGPNAAVIHYKPEKKTCAIIDPKAIYLCDSGAQFKYL
jgi:Xaa-Pro aminopeptidase